MSSMIRPLIKNEKGQALLELALVLPLLLILVISIVEFGRIGHAYLTLSHAAREGARIGVTGVNDEVITNSVKNATTTLNQEDLYINTSPPFNGRVSGEEMQVILDYSISFYMPFIDLLLPNPLDLQGKAVMRME